MRVVTDLPPLRNTSVIDVDGSGQVFSRPLRGGETVYTALIVEDTDPRGATVPTTLAVRQVQIEDNIAPVYFDYLEAGILQENHSVRPAGASAVQDDQEDGELHLYHVLTFGNASEAQLWDIVEGPNAETNRANGAFGSNVVPATQFVPNAPFSLSNFEDLAASNAVRFAADGLSWNLESVASAERKRLVSHLLARDSAERPAGTPNPNRSRIQASFDVLDVTVPAVSGVEAHSVAETSFTVKATVVDAGDANARFLNLANATTAVHAGLFLKSDIGTATPIFNKSTGGFTHNGAAALQSKALDAGADNSYSVQFTGLSDYTEYVAFVAAVDGSGNVFAPSAAASATFRTLDGTAPILQNFNVIQVPASYKFRVSGGTIRDNAPGPLKAYLVMATTDTLTLAAVGGADDLFRNGSLIEKDETIVYDSAGSYIHVPVLETTRYWNGSAFADIAETAPGSPYQLHAHLFVLDARGNTASAATAKTVADRTAPAGLASLAIDIDAISSNSITVSGLDGVTDGRGVSQITLRYGTSAAYSPADTTPLSFSPSGDTYKIDGLANYTLYYIWASAADDAGNAAGPVQVGAATRTLDSETPVITSFNVEQATGTYAFAPSAGTVTDNAPGPLKAYLVMAASAMTTAQLANVVGSVEATAKKEDVASSAGTAVTVSSLGLSTAKYWTGTAFADIAETAPGSPYQLYAHLYVIDASGNVGSAANSGAAKTVADRTAPQLTGTLTLAATGSAAFKVSWAAGAITDGRASPPSSVFSATVYYSTAAPTSTSAEDIAAWKNEATTYTKSVATPGTAFGGTGEAPVDELSAATTYYAYLSVEDAAGNVADFATTPASVATEADAPTTPAGIPNVIDVNAAAAFNYSEYSSELVAHGQYAYFIPANNTNLVRRYDHNARTWSAMSALPQTISDMSAVAVDPANGDLYVFIPASGVYKWTGSLWSQYGAQFTQIVAHNHMVVSGGTVYYADERNDIVKLYKNDGSAWTLLGSAGSRSVRKMVAMHGTKVYIGYGTAGTATSTVGMAEYDTVTGVFTDRGAISGTSGGYHVTVAASADGAYISFPQNNVGATVYKLANGAYTLLGSMGFGGWTAGRRQLANVSVDSGGGVYCTGMDGKLYRYDGNAWQATLTFTTNPGSLSAPMWFYAISQDTNMHHVLYSEGTATALRHAVMVHQGAPVPTTVPFDNVATQNYTDPRGVTFNVLRATQNGHDTPYSLANDPIRGRSSDPLTIMLPMVAGAKYSVFGDRTAIQGRLSGANPLPQVNWGGSLTWWGPNEQTFSLPGLNQHMDKFSVLSYTHNGSGTWTVHYHLADGSTVFSVLNASPGSMSPQNTYERLVIHHQSPTVSNVYYVGPPRVFSRALTAAEVQAQAEEMLAADPAAEYYGDYTGSTVADGPAVSPALAAMPVSFTFAKDADDIYLSTGALGPAALLRYDHATRAFTNLGLTPKTTASVTLNYRGHGVAIVDNVPYVVERYKDATTQGHVVHRYVAGAFQQVGATFGADGFGLATSVGHVLIKHDPASGRLYVGYIAGTTPKIMYIASPGAATSTTEWQLLSLSGAAAAVQDFYFAFAPSGLMWLLMINSGQFAAYTVSVSGSAGSAAVKRGMGTLGSTSTVYHQGAAFVAAYDDANVAMTVGINANSAVIVVNGTFKYPVLPLPLEVGADTVGFDAYGRVFAVAPGDGIPGQVYRYLPSTDTWTAVGPTFTNVNNRGVLAVSNNNGDIVVAGFDATTFAYRVIRPTAVYPAPAREEGAGGGIANSTVTLTTSHPQSTGLENMFDDWTRNFSGYSSPENPTRPIWIQADFKRPITVRNYRIWASSITGGVPAMENYGPKTFTIQGSNDATFATFVTLDEKTGLAKFPATDPAIRASLQPNRSFRGAISSPGSYRYYRLHITDIWDYAVFHMGEWQLSTTDASSSFDYVPRSTVSDIKLANPALTFANDPSSVSSAGVMTFGANHGSGFYQNVLVGPTSSVTFRFRVKTIFVNNSYYNTQFDILANTSSQSTGSVSNECLVISGSAASSITYSCQGGYTTTNYTDDRVRLLDVFLTYKGTNQLFVKYVDAELGTTVVQQTLTRSTDPFAGKTHFGFGIKRMLELHDFDVYVPAIL